MRGSSERLFGICMTEQKTRHGVWVGYKCRRGNGSQLVGENVNIINSIKISMTRTQPRSHPGTTSIYDADVAERCPRNLSNRFDNAFIQQQVPIYNLGAVLLPGPYCRVSYEGSRRSFFESVRSTSVLEVRGRARFHS